MLDSAPGQILRAYRVPAGFPGIHLLGIDAEPEGAMPPVGAAGALSRFADEMEEAGYPRPWNVEVHGQSTPQDLVTNLQEGKPTMIFGVWDEGTPHAVVVAGYDGPIDTWSILDPGYPLIYDANSSPVFREWNTAELEHWWGQRYIAYERNTMVLLDLNGPLDRAAAPTPSPQRGSTPTPE